MRTIKEIDKEIAEKERQRESIILEYDKLSRKISSLINKINKLKEEKTEIVLSKKQTDWKYLLHEDGIGCNMKRYHGLEAKLKELGMEFSNSGYNPKTNQTVIRLGMRKSSSVTKVRNGILKLLKYLKPIEEGYVYFSIFENSLSANGSYTLLIKPDDRTAYIRITRYGRKHIVLKEDKLDTVLGYIKKHLYYGDD